MDSPAFLEVLNRSRDGAPTIIGAGRRSREFRAIVGDDPSVLHSMDMPYATPFCLGLARATGLKKVVALEGDGNVLAGLGTLSTVARYRPENLVIVVCDNESYASFGDGAIATATGAGADLEGIARACGIENACTVRDLVQAEEALRRAFAEPGPWLIVAKVTNRGDADARFWIGTPDIVEAGFAFQQFLRSHLGGSRGSGAPSG